MQIATASGLISHLVHLSVVSPKAVIPGNGEYHIETGSTISLDCYIEQVRISLLNTDGNFRSHQGYTSP